MTQPLWMPDDTAAVATQMAAFQRLVEGILGRSFPTFGDFYAWTVADADTFWRLWWDAAHVCYEGDVDPIHVAGLRFQDHRFFPNIRLNYAENLLQPWLDYASDSSATPVRHYDQPALVFWAEHLIRDTWSGPRLLRAVASAQTVLRDLQIGPGDCVVGYLPNCPQAVVWMLATTALGGVWSSCSQDFGLQAAVDRFGQLGAKVLVAVDGAVYKGRSLSSLEKAVALQHNLKIPAVWMPYLADHSLLHDIQPEGKAWQTWREPPASENLEALTFTRVGFNDPLFVLFSSGTTGLPKCLVHGVGGTLLNHLKEHRLHSDIRPQDALLYYTTTGWMMWNWQVSALASGATVLLYDGAPLSPDAGILWQYASQNGCTHFGVSAKYVDTLRHDQQVVAGHYDLSALRMILSTGSPLVAEGFDYVYAHIKRDVCLASISGGTDILGCFALGNPSGPVYAGELQTRGLGLAVDIFDADGRPVHNQKGELVCTQPFPNMPIGFWGDAEGHLYHRAYFETFPHIWCHGDYAQLVPHGAGEGLIIYGRSDATLNSGGVRIGTAEIYRYLADLPEIAESLVLGRPNAAGDDTEVWLFVVLKKGVDLTPQLETTIRQHVKNKASPRHVPHHIRAVPDVPKTTNGKLAELAAHKALAGEPILNTGALANPESLDYFTKLGSL